MRIAIMALMLGIAVPALAQSTPAAPPPNPCAASEFRQFDFWVGYWDVYPTGTDQVIAHSKIEKLYNGCAIRENWIPLKGGGGGSLNTYVMGAKEWRQLWTDSSGTWAEFRGGWDGKAMVITGTGFAKPGVTTRMTYTPHTDGSVRQHGENSADKGTTWTTSFDFTYRPAKEPTS